MPVIEKVKTALTRKYGPLPGWAWVGGAAGAVWLWRISSRRDRSEEVAGEMIPGQGDFGFTPSAQSPMAPYGGFETQVSGTETGRATIQSAEGGLVEVEGPFDFVERVIAARNGGSTGGVATKPPPTRKSDPAPKQPKPEPRPKLGINPPANSKPVPLRKPDPQPSSTPAKKTYTVARGDTLWAIARRFGYSHWRPIYDANRGIIGGDPDLIRPGQTLVLP